MVLVVVFPISVAETIETAIRAAMPVSAFTGIGMNVMSGLKLGIMLGRSGVITAMRQAARDAVNAAKEELQINSPSKVFRDEIGAMTMKGLGEGVLKESRAQAKVIQNAARYLTGEAKVGSITTTSNDNRKTYNSSSTISFEGSNFYVNDKTDVQSLAVEIAGLTKRRQVGRGIA